MVCLTRFRSSMSRKFYIFLTLCTLLCIANAEAQTIALGERTPRFKNEKWLNGHKPEESGFTYIEFIHTASKPCRQSAERIHKIVSELNDIAFVLITQQTASEIDDWVVHYEDRKSGVIVDNASIRKSFGVNYAPYGVIIDHKRRALWFGNPQLLNRATIEKLTKNGERKTEN